jgi:hypothetical protein
VGINRFADQQKYKTERSSARRTGLAILPFAKPQPLLYL